MLKMRKIFVLTLTFLIVCGISPNGVADTFYNEANIASLSAAPLTTDETEESDVDTTINDIDFPFPEYPAEKLVYAWPYPTASSYFHRGTNKTVAICDHQNGVKNCVVYGGTRQCDGFAVYAHERYIHLEDWTRTMPYRQFDDTTTIDRTFYSESSISAFFSELTKGAYIRYGKLLDSGVCDDSLSHSVVFVSKDSNGVWVYECNQDYKCGVYYQYYTFQQILNRYHCASTVVSHTFTDAEYLSTQSHKIVCEYCDGYLVQDHTSIYYGVYSFRLHTVHFLCCGGSYRTKHTPDASGICTACGYETST